MKTILVSGASGIVGYGILRSLRASELEVRLIGTSIYDDSVAPAFCDVFELAPRTGEAEYVPWLLDTIRSQAVDMIIPGIEADMYEWMRHSAEIQAAGALPLQNDLALTALCEDKWEFFENISAAGFHCAIDTSLSADFDELATRFGVPFLLKPRRGFGSKGIARIHSEEEFDVHRTAMGKILMAQPIVGDDDDEYTTAAFGDGRGGYYAAMTLRRKLSSSGFTDRAEVVSGEPFKGALRELCHHFRPHGPSNFQFRMTDEGIKLLEINPRISSSTSIRAAFGYNESVMAVDYFLNGRIPEQPAIGKGRAVRYTEDFIFHDDRVHL